jgi:hypothetical protein
MLITAGHFWLHAPHRFNPGGNGLAYLHGYATNSRGDSRYNNSAAFDDLAAIPNGATGQTAWVLPRKAGGMSSTNEADISLTTSGSILAGKTESGSATIGIDTNIPDGQLVSTVPAGGAPASFDISTNTPLLTASISGDNAGQPCDIGINTNVPTLGAIASLTITPTSFGMTGTLTRYAIGIMEGTTADTGVTVDNIVTALESAVLPVNIVKVNDYAVTGTGQSGNEWGPV